MAVCSRPTRIYASLCVPCLVTRDVLGPYMQATHLIKYLQSMRNRRLWAYEDVCMDQSLSLPSAAALTGMVQHCLEALEFESSLQQAWFGVALEWALHVRSRHLACRSQQVRGVQANAGLVLQCMRLLCCWVVPVYMHASFGWFLI